MRITLVRTGGVTGIRKETMVDTGKLEPQRARQLEECVGQCRFFALPPQIGEGKAQPDRFQFALTVEDGVKSHTVRFPENQAPPALHPVIEMLKAK